jgi:hypothetical protein
MRTRLVFGVLLAVSLGLAVTTSGKPAKPPSEIPVTVTVADGANGIQSDTEGPYAHGTAGVRAVLVPLGNVVLDLRNTLPARELFLDFSACASSSPYPCDPPLVTTVVAFLSTSSCHDGSLLEMLPGEPQDCTLGVNFAASGLGWFIRFGEYEGTTHAKVLRLQDGSWTIDVPANGVAKLLSYPTKGRVVLTDRGDFVMPAHLEVKLLP